jgi:hypothetical protein
MTQSQLGLLLGSSRQRVNELASKLWATRGMNVVST